MAGLSGPDLNEFGQLKPADEAPSRSSEAGEVRDATGGRRDFPGVSAEGFPKDCSNGLGSREK